MARQIKPESKPESKLSEAADKATAMLQGLQSRLHQVAPREVASREETPDELDRQLREYFVAESGNSRVAGDALDSGALNQIQERVIDAVADRILDHWERGEQRGERRESGALESKVIDRLAQRILERMARR